MYTVHQASKKWETYKVQLKGLVRSIDGPWWGFDPIGVGSCVPRVHGFSFWSLECKNIVIMGHIILWANLPPCCIEDFNITAELGLTLINNHHPLLWKCNISRTKCLTDLRSVCKFNFFPLGTSNKNILTNLTKVNKN